jgi:hypothetical protein
MSWSALSGATGCIVERSTDGANYSQVYSGTARTYTNTNITPAGEYYHRVLGTTTAPSRSVYGVPIFAAAWQTNAQKAKPRDSTLTSLDSAKVDAVFNRWV